MCDKLLKGVARMGVGALVAPNGHNVSWARIDYLTDLGLAPWYLPPTAYRHAALDV